MRIRDYLALYLGGAFRVDGLTVVHGDLLIDQTEVAQRIAAARARLGNRSALAPRLLARVTLHLVRESPLTGVDVQARWLGGFFDRGEIRIRATKKWPELFEGALFALLAIELGVEPIEVGGGQREVQG